jgi:hypothetical protein
MFAISFTVNSAPHPPLAKPARAGIHSAAVKIVVLETVCPLLLTVKYAKMTARV